MAVQLNGTNGFCGAVGERVDRARQDFLAGAAFAGDENADVGDRDAPGDGHQLAHLAGHDRLSALERHIVDRPERQAFFAFGARALHFVQ